MKVVIAGGVAAGAGTAARLRRICEEAEIILFEKDDYISYAACGLPYFIGDVITDGSRLLLQTPQSFKRRYNVDVRTSSQVLSVSPEQRKIEVKNLKTGKTFKEAYDVLVLAPGAIPLTLQIPGISMPHVFTLRSISDSFKIKDFIAKLSKKKGVIAGGGYTGIEMADNLKKLGMDITIIEKGRHIISSFDEDMAHDLHNHIRSKGVSLVLSDYVKEITSEDVILASGKHIPADFVLVSAGVRPDTDFLAESGIKLGLNGGIIVDEHMRTTDPSIYAAGDAVIVRSIVTGQFVNIPLAGPAHKQARIVADNILHNDAPVYKYAGSSGTGILKVFDMTAGMTGCNEAALNSASLPYYKSIITANSHASYYPGVSSMTVKLIFSPDGTILGAQVAGFDAADKITDVLSAAIRMKCTIHDIAEFEHGYAPPYSSAKDPVNIAGFVAGHILEKPEETFYIENIPSISEKDSVLDIRTADEFRWGHLPNAISIPLDTLRENVDKLDKNRIIYAYCQHGQRGNIAVRILLQNGFKAKNLCGGYRLYQAMLTDRDSIM